MIIYRLTSIMASDIKDITSRKIGYQFVVNTNRAHTSMAVKAAGL